jgi:hypothetical protein
MVGAVWACAQSPDLISPLWESESVLQESPREAAESQKTAAEHLEKQLSAPDIWRLPPVNVPATPTALALPPIDMIPGPSTESLSASEKDPPIANAPVSLSGEFSDPSLPIQQPSAESEKLWDGSFDLGLDGSEGNSETFNFRFGCHANRKQESNILTLGIDYNKSTAETKATTNRLFFEGRFEWLIHQTRWSWFVHETVEYDEFQSFNVRDTSDAGLGYRLIRNENTTLIGRIGGGFSHEYGGPDDGQYTPEAVFGLQVERHISKRQKLLGLVEYAPDIGYFLDYRIRTQAAWEVLLDADRNLSLRVGVLDRYTSQPNGVRSNDLDYASVLIWKF